MLHRIAFVILCGVKYESSLDYKTDRRPCTSTSRCALHHISDATRCTRAMIQMGTWALKMNMCRYCSVKASGSFKRNGWGGAICESMAPASDDVIIQGKSGLCGFASTNLNFVLAHNHIENVVLAGFLVSAR